MTKCRRQGTDYRALVEGRMLELVGGRNAVGRPERLGLRCLYT